MTLCGQRPRLLIVGVYGKVRHVTVGIRKHDAITLRNLDEEKVDDLSLILLIGFMTLDILFVMYTCGINV